jgi:hypothetical protein
VQRVLVAAFAIASGSCIYIAIVDTMHEAYMKL